MMNRLRDRWEQLRSSLWFLPALIVVGAVLLAVGLIDLEGASSRAGLTARWPRLFGAGAVGARGLLSAIASSMITVAGVTFSITVVALALASSQYTSRILANFMRDRANQTVLGVFLGIFAYCLVVLRTIRGGDEGVFVPALAVLGAVILALLAIGVLIFFIHHIASSIQATSIIARTASETIEAVDRLFPTGVGEGLGPAAIAGGPAADLPVETVWTPIPSAATGYIQGVDAEALLGLAREADLVVRMEHAVGDFVIEGHPLASLSASSHDAVRRLNAAYSIGRYRTVHQDASYGIRQIVDVALKALSPGVNDTTTAIICIDYLSAVLARLATRRVEATHRFEDGELRVVARGSTFDSLLSESFDQIRQNGGGNVAVILRLLRVIEVLLERTRDGGRRASLRRHVALITELAARTVPAEHDRADIREAIGGIELA